MGRVILFAVVDPLSFSECMFQFGGIGMEGVDDLLQATVVTGTVLEPLRPDV